MATRRWFGRAGAVPQVTTLTPAVISVGSTFTVTINNRAVTVTATTTVVADVTALLVAALASDYPEFQEITFTDSTTLVTATGPDDGTPFTLALTAGGTGSPTFTQSTTTSPSGPNWWSVAANWRENSVPVTGDDVIIDEGPSIKYGLDQNTVTLASLRVTKGFPRTSEIGLPRNTNTQNQTDGYPQYRDTRLKIGVTTGTIDTVCSRIRLDLDTDQTALTILDTGPAPSTREKAVDVIGTHASSVLRANKGSIGVAMNAGETSQFATINVAFTQNQDGDVDIELGSGLTLATLEQSGGKAKVYGTVTTITREGGSMERYGTGTITTLNNRIGPCQDSGSGTITTLNNAGGYFRRGLAPLTVTNATLYGGGQTIDPLGVITWTNAPNFYECSPPGGQGDNTPPQAIHYFNFGRHRKITIADI